MNRPTHITFPRRWSRAKRKLVRARVMEAQWRAWFYEQCRIALAKCLDKVWGDAMKPSVWEDCEFLKSADGEFVDDSTFLVTP